MGIIWIEFCLISAHGFQHSTSPWKRRHWYAVGWIDVNSKYCTKVDGSGNENPVWRTKFAIPVDDSTANIQDLTLNIEVYSIDPIFFKEKLHGSATIGLEKFLVKQVKNSEVSKPKQEEVQSYELLKRKSSKPRGFIDVLIRISEEKKEPNSHTGSKEGILHLDHSNDAQLTTEGGLRHAYPQQKQPQASIHLPENHEQINVAGSYSVPFTTTIYTDPFVGEPSYHAVAGTSYQPPRTRIGTPPPPSNIGYIPTFLPLNNGFLPRFKDMPPSREALSQRAPPGVAMEISAVALAAGAAIFGEDFFSGFDVPVDLGDATFNLETDHPS